MKNGMKRGIGLAVALCALAIGSSAGASGRWTYSAATCVEGFDSTPESTYQAGGGIRTGAIDSIFCPIVRDDEASTLDVTDWDITVDRRGSASAWDVVLWSTSTSGLSGFTSTITVPLAPSSGAQDLDGGGVFTSHAEGMLMIRTEAPSGVQIMRYGITEN